MANDAMSAAERAYLAEPDRSYECDRCGDPNDGSRLCWRCADDEYEAELAATEGNEEPRS